MALFAIFLALFLSLNSRYENIKTEIGLVIVPPIERINIDEAKKNNFNLWFKLSCRGF